MGSKDVRCTVIIFVAEIAQYHVSVALCCGGLAARHQHEAKRLKTSSETLAARSTEFSPRTKVRLHQKNCTDCTNKICACHLRQEEDHTTVHLITQCSALMLLRKDIFGDFTLSLDTLSDIHWHVLLRFAKASKRFYRPWGLSGMRTGPVLWPQRWVSA